MLHMGGLRLQSIILYYISTKVRYPASMDESPGKCSGQRSGRVGGTLRFDSPTRKVLYHWRGGGYLWVRIAE